MSTYFLAPKTRYMKKLLLIFAIAFGLSCNNTQKDQPINRLVAVPIAFNAYYLSPSGNDNNTGTKSSPLFSLVKGWTKLNPGDTLYLRGGTYSYATQQYLQNKNGNSTVRIHVFNYPGETPVITDASNYTGQDLIYFEGSYIHWKGLELANFRRADFGWYAFRSQSSNNCIYEQFNVHHNRSAMGIRGASSGNIVLNSDFHHNSDPEDGYGGSDGLNISIVPSASATNTVRGCRSWYNSDDGFDYWQNEGYVLTENCWSFYNGFIEGGFSPAGDGGGYKLGETTGSYFSTVKRTLQNSIAYKNRKFGIVENNLKAKSDLLNNTVVNHSVYGYWVGAWNPSAIATIKNSVSYKQPNQIASHVVQVNNSWQVTTVSDGDFVSLDESQLLAPRKPDGSLPDLTFYKTTGIDIGGLGAVFQGVTPPPIVVPPTGDVVTKCQMVCYPVSGTLKTVTATSFTKKADGYYVGTSKREIHSYKDENGKWRFL